MTCSVSLRVGGVWRTAKKVFIRKAGAWQEAKSTSIHKAGAWHTCSSAPAVVPDKPLTGDIANLLKAPAQHTHTNSGYTITMEQQPADKVFPDGQKVYFGGYQTDYGKLQRAYDSGITVVGFQGAYYRSSGQLANATRAGMMYHVLIQEILNNHGGHAWELSCVIDGTRQSHRCMGNDVGCSGITVRGQSYVNGLATKTMSDWRKLNDDNIYGWLYGLDDCRTAAKTSHTNAIYKAIRDADPSKRTVGDFGFGNSYEDSADGRHRLEQITNTTSQQYYGGGDTEQDGDGYYKSRAQIGIFSKILKSNCDRTPSNNGKPRLIVQGWLEGYSWPVVTAHVGNYQYYLKEHIHDILQSLMHGSNGILYYTLSDSYGSNNWRSLGLCLEEKHKVFDAIFAATKLINKDHDVAKALVWGKRTGHVKAITVAGTNTYTYGRPITTGNMIQHVDIQFNHDRYVIVTNSTPTKETIDWWNANPNGVVKGQPNHGVTKVGCTKVMATWSVSSKSWYSAPPAPPKYDVPVTLSGFPHAAGQSEQYVVTELVSGAAVHPDSSGVIHTTMQPLDSRIYKISPAPGYIGGVPGGPVTPETQIPYNNIPSAIRTWIQTITHDSHPASIQPTDYRFTNRQRGEVYAYQDADNIIFYWPHGGNANFNFASFATHADIHWMKDNGSNLNEVIGSAQAITYSDGTNGGATVYHKTSGGSDIIAPHLTTPASHTVGAGARVVFSTVLTGIGSIRWEYSANGTTWHPITGSSGTTHIIASATTSQDGYKFRAIAHNSTGDFTSGAGTLHVTAAAVAPTVTGPADVSIKVGERGTFTIVATNYTNLLWQWHGPGSTTWINLADHLPSHPTSIQSDTSHDLSKFRCTVTGPGGSVVSREATLHVASAFIPAMTNSIYVSSSPWNITLTFNGTVRVINASLIRTLRFSSGLGEPAAFWGTSKNVVASGTRVTFNPNLPPSTTVNAMYILIQPGALTVNGVGVPKIEQRIFTA